MRCSSSSTPSSCSRSERRLPGLRLAVAFVALSLLAGCGGGETDAASAPEPETPEPSPIARLAVEGPVDTVDPILAGSRAERLIARQIFEPLTSRIEPPFAATGSKRGPARILGSDAGDRLWRFELRAGVVFSDGTPLNADAVVANHARWVQTGVAAELLPELEAVFSPRPGEVRFQLSRPVPDFPRQLADARLGLVAPGDIPAGASRAVPFGAAGSGPYLLQERQAGRVLLVRSTDWWGEGPGLGPGINQLDFLLVDSPGARLDRLIAGSVALADDLDRPAARRLAQQPLLAEFSDGVVTVGASAAVRGLGSVSADQSLSGLWLTQLR